jgi:5-methylcytosine-specific restriction endonuclease McrA
MKICSVEGCGKKHHSKGLCQKHRNQEPDRLDYIHAHAGRTAQAKKLGLLCGCCSRADFIPIYRECRTRGGCEVDHKKPLHLGGLHCVHNLQILTKEEHTLKSKGENADARFERALAKSKCDTLSTPPKRKPRKRK